MRQARMELARELPSHVPMLGRIELEAPTHYDTFSEGSPRRASANGPARGREIRRAGRLPGGGR
jgi:hypothetical protein